MSGQRYWFFREIKVAISCFHNNYCLVNKQAFIIRLTRIVNKLQINFHALYLLKQRSYTLNEDA
ncbi:MAG: hypothetical protein ACI8Q1_000757 [Parvicella sp.]|jgi:hypothetical protein